MKMKRKNKLVIWLIGGIILALGPIWGMLGTVVGMVSAFGHLAESEPQTEVLANDISLALYTTAAGLIVCPIGIVIIIVSAIKLSKAKKQADGIPNQKVDLIN
jgi:biopolymer transport protein ExbB